MIASPDQTTDTISPAQRWAHMLVLDILKANLPLPSLAAHLKIPFDTLVEYLNLPEVKAEIDAYEVLCALRARLLGQTARPISLRRLLDVLESPTPEPGGRDRDADQRTLHRHAELIRRTATTIARESRAVIPKPVSKHARLPSPTPTPPGATSSRRANSRGEAELVLDPPAPTQAPNPTPAPSPAPAPQKGAPIASSAGSSNQSRDPAPTPSPSPTPSDSLPPRLCGDSSSPRLSPVPALLRLCGTVRSRDHPAA